MQNQLKQIAKELQGTGKGKNAYWRIQELCEFYFGVHSEAVQTYLDRQIQELEKMAELTFSEI